MAFETIFYFLMGINLGQCSRDGTIMGGGWVVDGLEVGNNTVRSCLNLDPPNVATPSL